MDSCLPHVLASFLLLHLEMCSKLQLSNYQDLFGEVSVYRSLMYLTHINMPQDDKEFAKALYNIDVLLSVLCLSYTSLISSSQMKNYHMQNFPETLYILQLLTNTYLLSCFPISSLKKPLSF
jgi:hypothetical protein